MKNIIRRTTLKVRDIQKSYEFYTELLGMETYYNNEVTVENDLLPGTKAGDKIHLIILKAQDPVVGMIGLLKPIDPEEEFPAVEFDFKYGSSVFVVGVDDVEELYEKALKFGAKMRAPLSEPSTLAPMEMMYMSSHSVYMIQMVISWSVIKGSKFYGKWF